MGTRDFTKRKKRNKRIQKKIQRLLIVVIFVFSMCKSIEMILEAKQSVETLGNNLKIEHSIQYGVLTSDM